jgi:hypothetical protein
MNSTIKEKIEELKKLGFQGRSANGALLFCDLKINEYQVDIPVSLRDAGAKESAKTCTMFKKIRKELKQAIKDEKNKTVKK